MQNTDTPLNLLAPAEIQISETMAFTAEAGRSAATSSDASLRASPTQLKTAKRPASEAEQTPSTRPRKGARRTLMDEEPSPNSTVGTDVPSALPSPFDATTPATTADEPSPTSEFASPMSSPERKIWMRPCNECGVELHVRRVRCTECGAPQMSKRAYAAAQEEKLRLERRAALDEEKEVEQKVQAAEAEAAAKELALIASPRKAKAGEAEDEISVTSTARAEAAPAEAAAPSPVPAALPPASPAPSSSSVVSQLARLSPEQLQKLRRMQKLRALLQKLPPGVKLPPMAPPASAASTTTSGRATTAPSPDADAIAMLASVACM